MQRSHLQAKTMIGFLITFSEHIFQPHTQFYLHAYSIYTQRKIQKEKIPIFPLLAKWMKQNWEIQKYGEAQLFQ